MKPNSNFPVVVYQEAHAKYPDAVARKGLYGVAFFGWGATEEQEAGLVQLWADSLTEASWRPS